MGRWAQRRRSGGSKTSAAQPIPVQIVDTQIFLTDQAFVEYTGAIDAASLTPSDFKSENSNEVGASIIQADTNILTITFTGVITGDTDLEYTGTTPGVKTPDTVSYT